MFRLPGIPRRSPVIIAALALGTLFATVPIVE